MFSDELINFLKNNFLEQLGEISAAIDLLVESIDDAAEAIAAKGNKLSSDKEFKNAAVLMSRADELQVFFARPISLFVQSNFSSAPDREFYAS